MKSIKKFSVVITILMMPSALLAQTTYTIKGKVGLLSSPAIAYLMYSNATGWQTDSTTITNGVFVFTGVIDRPGSAYLMINKRGTGIDSKDAGYANFYLEAGIISVTSPDSIDNAKVTGGPINAYNAKLKIELAPVNAKMETFDRDYEAATDEQRRSKDFSDDINKRSASLEKEKMAVYLTFIKANPNSQMSLFALIKYADVVPDVNEVEPVFNSLSADVKGSKMGIDYAASIGKMKKTAIGAIAPDFTQADISGKAVSLHDFKGKYVLIDFWASWCGPCRAENPNVVKAFATYKDKGFTVLGVSLDQSGARDTWLKAIHDDHLTWTQVSDLKGWKNKVAQLYNVHDIPQNFLVGPDGKIIGKDLEGDDLDKKLKQLLL